MRLVVGDTSYDVVDTLQGCALGDLRLLKKDLGATVRTIQGTFTRLGEEAAARVEAGAESDNLALLEDDDFLQSMIGLIWLAKRRAGERLSIQDAEATPFDTFSLEDDEDEAEVVDPKAPTESSDPSV